ncbi:hypothetical protein [Shinella sp. G-2]|uniref:hypothetical protein n=1 Tax=Shinella sp. G-2 TaxID=3133141 RepID=UPI003CFC5349
MHCGTCSSQQRPHDAASSSSAIRLGLDYWLVYSTIQTQAMNDAPPTLRSAALPLVVIAYLSVFLLFPMLGDWLIVHIGNHRFLAVVLSRAVAELVPALLRLGGDGKKVASATQ